MKYLLLFAFLNIASPLFAKQWNVGPSRPYPTPAAVSNLVNHGDTILIDAALYANHPQVYFTKNNLLIRGIGGRPRLEAGAALAGNANGKAIFVISGSHCRVEHIEFANAAVPDHNGAGIRQEGCDLFVRDCFFTGNEMGILGGAYSPCTVTLEHNVFANNGSSANPGYQHNVYIGKIDTLIFRYNYSVNAIAEGHELKSRAKNNILLYNFIGNLSTIDSRTVDLPNGGAAILVGNILEQGPNSANSNIFGYGLEGLVNPPPHQLWMAHNTLVNKKSTGNFIQIAAGTDTLWLKNNILVGPKTSGLIVGAALHLDSAHNLVHNNVAVAGFANAAQSDYRLRAGSPAIDQGAFLDQYQWGNYPLMATFHYADTANFGLRPLVGWPDIGAYEFAAATSVAAPLLPDVTIFPNPCQNILSVSGAAAHAPYRIYTSSGQYVKGGIVMQGVVAVEDLPNGVYWIEICLNKRPCTKKIAIQRPGE
ncbi:MAG: T9SS type A sorting domain-containing protein [Saprospiraceae bacterium]|nr:T9SS type A sorting domain-containing protein [Saprospiraceae bacterium]